MNDFICWILQNVKYYTFKLFIVVMMIDQLVQTKTLILRRISIFFNQSFGMVRNEKAID